MWISGASVPRGSKGLHGLPVTCAQREDDPWTSRGVTSFGSELLVTGDIQAGQSWHKDSDSSPMFFYSSKSIQVRSSSFVFCCEMRGTAVLWNPGIGEQGKAPRLQFEALKFHLSVDTPRNMKPCGTAEVVLWPRPWQSSATDLRQVPFLGIRFPSVKCQI